MTSERKLVVNDFRDPTNIDHQTLTHWWDGIRVHLRTFDLNALVQIEDGYVFVVPQVLPEAVMEAIGGRWREVFPKTPLLLFPATAFIPKEETLGAARQDHGHDQGRSEGGADGSPVGGHGDLGAGGAVAEGLHADPGVEQREAAGVDPDSDGGAGPDPVDRPGPRRRRRTAEAAPAAQEEV